MVFKLQKESETDDEFHSDYESRGETISRILWNLRDDEGNQTDFNEVGDPILSVGDNTLDQRHDGDEDKDSNQNVANLLPDSHEKSDLFLLSHLVRTILLKTLLGLGRRQTLISSIGADAKDSKTILLGLGVPVDDLLLGGCVSAFDISFRGHGISVQIINLGKQLKMIQNYEMIPLWRISSSHHASCLMSSDLFFLEDRDGGRESSRKM